MHRFLAFQSFPAVLTAVLLASCGGGSGSASSPPPPPPAATHFSVKAPAGAPAGTAFNVTVTALDASNNSVSTYSGTVHFTSTDGQAGLPANTTLTKGMGNYQATLKTPGSQSIAATDTVISTITGTSNSIQVSALASGFTTTGSMLNARASHTATLLLDGTVLMAGGLNIESIDRQEWDFPIATAELFDAPSGTFAATGSMVTARSGHNATLLANAALAKTASYGKVLVTGGGGQTAELYDPASRLFTETGVLLVIRHGETATLLNTGEVLVAGGGTATAELYNPAGGLFMATTGSMAAPRTEHTATLLRDGRVLVAGGGTDTAELYDPTSGLFTATTGSMSKVRSGATATLLQDGTVLIAGPDATGERFDPTTGYFENVGPLVFKTAQSTANLRGNGTVLFSGGFTGGRTTLPSSFAQLYSPISQSFAETGSLNTARYEHSGTLLADGRVLIAGGAACFPPNPPVSTGSCYSLSSAELYQ
jgi:hypothetical protein